VAGFAVLDDFSAAEESVRGCDIELIIAVSEGGAVTGCTANSHPLVFGGDQLGFEIHVADETL
jgi:hypothetical protein